MIPALVVLGLIAFALQPVVEMPTGRRRPAYWRLALAFVLILAWA